MKRKIRIMLIILLSMYVSRNELKGSVSTGAQFLKIGPDARGNSLGGAVIAEVKGLSSLYWNPAGMNSINSKSMLLNYNKWISDINYIYVAYGMPLLLSKVGAIGIGITYVDMGEIESRDVTGEKGEVLSSYYLGVTAGYSTKIKKYDIGGNIKIFRQKLFSAGSWIGGIDIGGKMDIKKIKNLTIGLVIKNIGIVGAIENESDIMPITFQIGGYYKIKKKVNTINTMLSIDIPIDESPFINIGVEYGYKEIVYGRIGYKLETGGNMLGWTKGIAAGIGGKIKKINVNIDITWSSIGELGNSIQSTITYNF